MCLQVVYPQGRHAASAYCQKPSLQLFTLFPCARMNLHLEQIDTNKQTAPCMVVTKSLTAHMILSSIGFVKWGVGCNQMCCQTMLLATGTAGQAAPQRDLQHASAAMQQQAPTAPALQQPQTAAANHTKPPTGLRRGFLSGASYPKSRARSGPSSSARQGKPQNTVGAQIQTGRHSQAAFTGNVVEHSALPTDRQAAAELPRRAQPSNSLGAHTQINVSAATSSGQAEAALKRVSRFKQSRNVV